MSSNSDNRATPDWLRPPTEQAGLGFYVSVLRERIWIVVASVVIALGAAAFYLITAEKVYEANAQLLITPVPSEDPVMATLGLPRASNDPTRDVETAAALATSLDVAERASADLGTGESARALQRHVTAQPVASSNLVAITADGPTPQRAADVANAFATGMIEDRTATLQEQIDRILPQLEARADAARTDPATALALDDRVAQLEAIRAGQDPTLRVETEAAPPNAAASPRKQLTIGGALLAGLVLGIIAAFGAQTLDPRLRREEQLRSRYSLPILARVPRDTGRRGRPLAPGAIAPPTREAYRKLRANITAARRDPSGAHALLVTGSAPAEGKTSTALNLAASFALAGDRVILIEADLRRPAVAKTLGINVDQGVVGTLLENISLDDALLTTTPFGPNLQLLLADYAGGWMSELFSLSAAQRLLEETKRRADFVIVDSPPLTAVVDTLPLARRVDDVLIVSRLGVTRLDDLHELAELLASNGIAPVGFALVGTPRPEHDYYYYPAPAPDALGEITVAPGDDATPQRESPAAQETERAR